jgi:AsmA protein
MSSFLKFVGIAFAAVVLLVIAAAVIFAVTFDANSLKTQIVDAVGEETGRELAIDGDLELSLFPYLGFSIGSTRLADAPGFGDEPFLAFESAAASVRVLPLLGGNIHVGELRLEGLTVKAVTAADGTNNWDDLAELGDADADATPAGGGGGSGGDMDLSGFSIGSIVFRDARISYDDRSHDASYVISNWRVETGTVKLGQPVDLDMGLDLSASEPPIEGRVEASGRLTPHDQRTTLANSQLSLSLKGAALASLSSLTLTVGAEDLWVEPAGPFALVAPEIRLQAEGEDLAEPVDARITVTELTGNFIDETVSMPSLVASVYGLTMEGQASGRKILSGLELNGSITIPEFSPKEVTERAGVPLSPTADPTALTRASLSGKFATTPNSLRFDDMVLVLDDTTMKGYLAVVDLARQALRFDLAADQMTLDRYMAPASDVPAAAGSPEDVAIPVDDIRALDLDGNLTLERLSLGGLQTTNVQVTLKAADGTLRINPSRADMYNGAYEGDITIDASGDTPRLSINERLSGVDFGALSVDMFDNQQLTGALDGRITLSGTGATQSAIIATLGGDATFSFKDGAFLGIDIPFELQRGLSMIGRGSAPEGGSSGRTDFAELSGTAQVADGVMSNQDLVVRLPFIFGSGKGTVDLKDESLKYRLDLQFQKSPELPDSASDFVGLTLPVAIGGTLSEPALDVSGMAAELARERVEEEIDKVKDRALKEATDVLGGFLGGKKGKDKDQ